ncbi:MAG: GntR family transcriptional regulator, partial [Bacteroidaceae bacterium]|nr:GntR family transcriptional regulator [Bacteroidaceae bacterium]
MTEFKTSHPIYIQMAERLADDILQGVYPTDGKVPSVREYAALLGVNVNTAVKAYETLALQGVIYNRRGLGYFVSPDACDIIKQQRRQEFMQHNRRVLFLDLQTFPNASVDPADGL